MPAVFHNWNHGSEVRSWLVELMKEGFREYGDLSSIESRVEDAGEQVCGVRYAMEEEVPIPLLAQAVWGFYEPRDADRPWAKAVAVMRHEYAGHPIETK